MSDWQPYWDEYRRFQKAPDFPHAHEWIEIKRRGDDTSTVTRPRDIDPATNVFDLMWRPARPLHSPDAERHARRYLAAALMTA